MSLNSLNVDQGSVDSELIERAEPDFSRMDFSIRDWNLSRFSSIPFFLIHVAVIAVPFLVRIPLWTLWPISIFYFIGMFAVTGGYHRYFSHRTYKTSRGFQFALAFMAQATGQKGVLWWAAHHRHHHRHSDLPTDIHSPVKKGFWWSHWGWILSKDQDATQFDLVRDLARYGELRWLNKFYYVPSLSVLVLCCVAWGYVGLFVAATSVVLLWHGTFTINSLCHVFGTQRYKSYDTSRNNLWLALLTLGEGWHNNHHTYMHSTRQGFFWGEIDITYGILKILESLGLVWQLREPPLEKLNSRRL
jgi:stearoyl-CoA desaturase (delta-9 desaturase)